jgi:hypothetical protein
MARIWLQGVLVIAYAEETMVSCLLTRYAAERHEPSGVSFSLLICAVGLWVLPPLTGLLYQPRMIGDGDCGEIGGIKIGRGNRSTRRKPAPSPLSLPQKSHD